MRYRSTGTTPPDVRRGDIHTAAARGAYTGKPRRSRSSRTTGSIRRPRLPSCRLPRVMSRHP
ncbi:Uncharacterised protein [Mycobacterium tuberculosis]|nr:Uncharacterised protein [Mycobacterium tuberculosis]